MRFIDPFGLQQDTVYIPSSPIPEATVNPKSDLIRRIFYHISKVFKTADNFVTGEPEPEEETVVEDGIDMDWFRSKESYGNRNVISWDNSIFNNIFSNRKGNLKNNSSKTNNVTFQTTDDETIEKSAGNNKEIIENNLIVKKYSGQTSANTDSIDIIYHKNNGLNGGGQIVRQRIPINDTSKYHIMQRGRVRKNRK